MLLDVNGNMEADAGEPTALTDTNGRFELPYGENPESDVVLLASSSCIDSYTGLPQLLSFAASPHSTAVSPLSQLMVTQATSDALTPADAMRVVRDSLNISVTKGTLDALDLQHYQPFEQLISGQDACLSTPLVVRLSQTQLLASSLALAVTTAEAEYLNISTKALQSGADAAFGAIANLTRQYGFAGLDADDQFVDLVTAAMDDYLISSGLPAVSDTLGADKVSAIGGALRASYDELSNVATQCAVMNTWESSVLELHNTARASHCAQPMLWDAELASTASSHVQICPANADAHSQGVSNDAFGENIGVLIGQNANLEFIGDSIFASWYSGQASAYDGLYYAALGPCENNGIAYLMTEADATARGYDLPVDSNGKVLVCIPQTESARVLEFTQLLWASHTRVGCAINKDCNGTAAMVCQYAGDQCPGANCTGNIYGQYSTNVLPTGNACTQRAWPVVQMIAKNVVAITEVVVPQVEQLIIGNVSTNAFINATSRQAIRDRAAVVRVPAQDAPLQSPPPPLPPPAQPPSRPPPSPNPYPNLPLLGDLVDIGALSVNVAGDSWSSGEDAWIPIFVIVLLSVLFCCLPTIIYRVSGGNVKDWLLLQVAHSNPSVSCFYLTEEGRNKIKAKIERDKIALAEIMNSYGNPVIGFIHIFLDKKTYTMTRLNNEEIDDGKRTIASSKGAAVTGRDVGSGKQSVCNSAFPLLSTPCRSAAAPLLANEESDVLQSNTASSRAVVQAAADPNDVFEDTPEERERRIEWIKYYVRIGEPDKARALGWDGKPFKTMVAGVTHDADAPRNGS